MWSPWFDAKCLGCAEAGALNGWAATLRLHACSDRAAQLRRPCHLRRKVILCRIRRQVSLVVQTCVLADGDLLVGAGVCRDGYLAAGVLKLMTEANAAGQLIPDETDAAGTAGLCACKPRHLRDASEAAGTVPPVSLVARQ